MRATSGGCFILHFKNGRCHKESHKDFPACIMRNKKTKNSHPHPHHCLNSLTGRQREGKERGEGGGGQGACLCERAANVAAFGIFLRAKGWGEARESCSGRGSQRGRWDAMESPPCGFLLMCVFVLARISSCSRWQPEQQQQLHRQLHLQFVLCLY